MDSTPTTDGAPATRATEPIQNSSDLHNQPIDAAPTSNIGPPTNALRRVVGVVLFIAWIVATILWVATNVHLVVNGDAVAGVTAVAAVALLVLLGGMEGLEVSVIDRHEEVWPGRTRAWLAGWLAARQFFVAVIVTTATLLANRSAIIIPGTSARITGGFFTGLFDLLWVGLTVLWFAQILWKHLGATNPDRYLSNLKPILFPIVHVVYWLGISQPGEWTADCLEYTLDWPAAPGEIERRLPVEALTHAAIWRELRPERHRHRKQGVRRKSSRP